VNGTCGCEVQGHYQPARRGESDYDGIAGQIDGFEEVQAVEIKPLAFGMMFIEVQVVLGEGEGIVDGFEDRVRGVNPLVGQIEALEMGRL